MSDDKTANTQILVAPNPHRRPSPLLVTGSVLWVLCLVGIAYGWYEWRQRHLELKSVQPVENSTEKSKQFRLAPQRDGGFVVKEAANDDQESAWDVEGIEDFSFTDCNGQKLTKQDLLGKPFIIAFVFTLCRGPCPDVTKMMRETRERLREYEFNLVTLTVDPARDTLETLLQYGKEQGADFDQWKFLTGDQSEIYGLIHRSFKMPVKELEGSERQTGFEIIHSTNIMLVDDTGHVVGKYNALKDDEMAKLRRKIKRIAKSKTDDKPVKEGRP